MVSEGDRIELVSTSDPYTNLSPGDRGTVTGTNTLPPGVTGRKTPERKILVDWDSGSSLALVVGEDKYRQVEEDENRDNT